MGRAGKPAATDPLLSHPIPPACGAVAVDRYLTLPPLHPTSAPLRSALRQQQPPIHRLNPSSHSSPLPSNPSLRCSPRSSRPGYMLPTYSRHKQRGKLNHSLTHSNTDRCPQEGHRVGHPPPPPPALPSTAHQPQFSTQPILIPSTLSTHARTFVSRPLPCSSHALGRPPGLDFCGMLRRDGMR